MTHEYEYKFLDIDAESLREKLLANGYVQQYPERLMRRTNFHSNPREYGKFARVRDEGNKITLTVKQVLENKVDGVKEAEVVVDSFEQASQLLQMLNYFPTAYQETKREKWVKDTVEVVMDTWPGLPQFCEVEAPSIDMVNEAAKELGFDVSEGVSGCVDVLYEKYLGIAPNDINAMPRIEFSDPPKAVCL